jgi:hypothetical protein
MRKRTDQQCIPFVIMQYYLHLWEDEGQIRRQILSHPWGWIYRRLCGQGYLFCTSQHATKISSGAAEASALGAKTRDHDYSQTQTMHALFSRQEQSGCAMTISNYFVLIHRYGTVRGCLDLLASPPDPPRPLYIDVGVVRLPLPRWARWTSTTAGPARICPGSWSLGLQASARNASRLEL